MCLQTKDWTTDEQISQAVSAAAATSSSSSSSEEEEEEEEENSDSPYTPSDYAYALTLSAFLSTLPPASPVTLIHERETSYPSVRRWRCCLANAVAGRENVKAEVRGQ